MDDLVKEVLPIMTKSLVDPFTNFVGAYEKVHTGFLNCLQNMKALNPLIPVLIKKASNPPQFLEQMKFIGDQIHQCPKLTNLLTDLEAKALALFREIATQASRLNLSPNIEKIEKEVASCLKELVAAEQDLNKHKALEHAQKASQGDTETYREALKARQKQVKQDLEENRRSLQSLTAKHGRISQEYKLLFWKVEFGSETDNSDKIATTKQRIEDLDNEDKRLKSDLEKSVEDLKQMMNEATSVEGARLRHKNAKQSYKKAVKAKKETQTSEMEKMLAKMELGDVDATKLSQTLHSIRSIVNNIKPQITEILAVNSVVKNAVAQKMDVEGILPTLTGFVGARLYYTSFTGGPLVSAGSSQLLANLKKIEGIENSLKSSPRLAAKITIKQQEAEHEALEGSSEVDMSQWDIAE